MTKHELGAVVETMADVADSWNDAAADGDRGRGNDQIVISVFDDGSGSIGKRSWNGEVEDLARFDDAAALVKIFEEEYAYEFGPSGGLKQMEEPKS